MKIAFVSFEYPPDTAFGGIGTYVAQAAAMLAERGHQVEVFAGGTARASLDQNGVRVHRIQNLDQLHFYREIFPVFAHRHAETNFDVVESPDYRHDGYWIAKKLPDLPHVMRLHSGTASSNRLFQTLPPQGPGAAARRVIGLFRSAAGALRRGLLKNPEGFDDYLRDVWNPDRNDREAAQKADLVISPCLDLLKFQMKEWQLQPEHLALLPYVYAPHPDLLAIPCGTNGKTIGYFGQMSERKGLRTLGHALPLIFARHPDARFKFVGRDYRTKDGKPWPDFLRACAEGFADRLEFTGQIALADMPAQYAQVDVCVFPSIWENFPNVCLEAMSAGRAVAGSWSGGMAEILDSGEHGVLFPPNSPERLTEAVSSLLDRPEWRRELGTRGRARVLSRYGRSVIAPLQEELYRRTIQLNRIRNRA